MADDWIYADAARTFAQTGEIQISPISLPMSVFEAVYGGVFVSVLGDSWGALILASAVLAAISGFALFDLVWRATDSPVLSLLAVISYLFTPILFALNSTFMTDGHAIALAVIAAALFSRGLERVPPSYAALVAGSLVATVGFLSRPTAVLVVLGPLLFAVQKRSWPVALAASVVPGATVATYLLIQRPVGARALIISEVSLPDAAALAALVALAIVAIGLGLTAFAIVGIPTAWALVRESRAARVWTTVVAVTAILLVSQVRLLDWLNPGGAYPIDTGMLGGRTDLLPHVAALWALLGVGSIVSCILVVAAGAKRRLTTGEVSLGAVAAGSMALTATSLASTSGVPLDRHVIVLLPAVVVFVALRSPRPQLRAAAFGLGVTALIALVSVGLTLDGRRLQAQVFQTALSLTDTGIVDPSELDAGASWVSLEHGASVTAESASLPTGRSPWWQDVFAPNRDFRWVVSLNTEIEGCEIHRARHQTLFGPDVDIIVTDRSCA